MKNVLFASTALVAATLGTTSYAAEPVTASLGGYMMIGLTYADVPGTNDIGVLRDSEIHFNFKGVADNGLTFDGRVELEAFSMPGGDQIDENWARVSGSFGSIMIGANDSASNAHEVGVFYGPGSRVGYWDSFYVPFYTTSGQGDDIAIRYTTPDLMGFSASVDYAPSNDSDGANDTALSFGNDKRWSVGASYEGEFDGIGVAVGGGYIDAVDMPKESWHAGGMVSYMGASLGIHYDSGGIIQDVIALGAQYETGPWTFAGGWAITTTGDTINQYGAWATYALAPGVTGTLGYEGTDNDTRTNRFGQPAGGLNNNNNPISCCGAPTTGAQNAVTAYLRIAF